MLMKNGNLMTNYNLKKLKHLKKNEFKQCEKKLKSLSDVKIKVNFYYLVLASHRTEQLRKYQTKKNISLQ